MADRESALLPRGTAHDNAVVASAVQQAHGVSVAHGNVVQAGGNVSMQTFHYHGPPQQVIDIVEVLRPVPNLRRIQLDVLSKATPGTAIWVMKTEYFLLWLDPNGNLKILWGTGIPGAGKSVMASVVIKDLETLAERSGGSICVAYLYFRYSDVADLTVRGVLEILVKQTVERHSDCALLADEAYSRHLRERTRPTQAELLQLLHRFTKVKAVTFYVLDALDEAPEKLRVDIVRTLALLNAKLFITSRPLKAIEEKFSDTHSFSIVAQDADLDLHIHQEISRSENLENLLEADPSFKEEVMFLVKKNCGGMFLHASLQLSAICRCTSTQDIVDTLKDFPSDIENVYNSTWTRIVTQTPRNCFLAKAVLVWVLNATRSMTIEELRRAVATHPNTHKFERKRLAPAATLLTLCCGLIIVEEETKLVRLIHYTAKDTLDNLLRATFQHPHSLLAAVCMTHLAECGFQDSMIESMEELTAAFCDDPLLAYASEAWPIHVRASLDVPESRRIASEFVSQCKALPSFTTVNDKNYFDVLPTLHILAAHTLPLTPAAVYDVADGNIATKKLGITPLMLASWFGNIDMVKLLLGWKGVDVNLTSHDNRSALMHAARNGHEDVAKAFLARPEIQVNLVDHEGWSALMATARYKYEGFAKALLAHPDIQVNLVNNEGWSALMQAAAGGYEDITKALLAQPEIHVNLVTIDGWSALMLAALFGHDSIVKALLQHPEIQVNLVNDAGESALMAATSEGHRGVVELLLEHPEIQVEVITLAGDTALTLAEQKGHSSIVDLLSRWSPQKLEQASVSPFHKTLLSARFGGLCAANSVGVFALRGFRGHTTGSVASNPVSTPVTSSSSQTGDLADGFDID